jgi:molybdopterin molybdotransferase
MVSHSDTPQRISRLTPLDDVLSRIAALVEPVEPREVEAAAALGASLAEAAVLHDALPPLPLALRDGWAVASDATIDAGTCAPAPLPAAVRIDVGQPLPPGTDAVAPLDTVTMRNGAALALAPVPPGEGVIPRGGDVAPASVLPEGRRLGRLQVALLAAAGVAVRVRAPRVRLVRARSGSDPVIDATVDCIADAIRAMSGIVAPAASSQDLGQALMDGGTDAVVTIGGTGSGTSDATVRTLASVGEVIAHGIGLMPGETTAFGRVGARPVLALPGRLDAALAAWHMLGRAVLARLADSREPLLLPTAKLAHKVTSTVGLAELVPVRCEDDIATPIASGYVPLSALAQANGWIFIKPDSEGYPAGSEVSIRPWP